MENEHETIQLVTVGQSEVEEMLGYYESGMSDRTTQNAVAFALQKILKPNIRFKIFHNAAHNSCECRIEERIIELPSTLMNWLEKAEHALPVNPISFPVLLKDEWLMTPSASSEPMPIDAPKKPRAA